MPTNHAIDKLTVGEKDVEVTVCDLANLCVFVHANDMGITGTESATEISNNTVTIALAKELRGKTAHLLGMCKDWRKVDEDAPILPLVVMVSSVSEDVTDAHLNSRLLLNNACHDSMAGTGATCTAGCSRIKGSIVNRVVHEKALDDEALKISHPLGIMPAWVEAVVDGKRCPTLSLEKPEFNVLAFIRTSRRIMDGNFYVPEEVWDGKEDLFQNGNHA